MSSPITWVALHYVTVEIGSSMKFKYGDSVVITSGFFKDTRGVVIDCESEHSACFGTSYVVKFHDLKKSFQQTILNPVIKSESEGFSKQDIQESIKTLISRNNAFHTELMKKYLVAQKLSFDTLMPETLKEELQLAEQEGARLKSLLLALDTPVSEDPNKVIAAHMASLKKCVTNLPKHHCAYCSSPTTRVTSLKPDSSSAFIRFTILCDSCGKEDMPSLREEHLKSILIFS